MNVSEETARLYGKIFTSFEEKDFELLRKAVSPKAFNEDGNFFKGKKILDLGCGGLGNAIASFLAHGASEVIAVDFSSENINALKKKFDGIKNVTLLNLDINALPSDLVGFDLVYANGVIHHNSDPQKIISNVWHRLKPNGTFILGLYGKGGLIPKIIDVLRLARPLIPQDILFKFLNSFWKSASFYLMDYIFVPILNRYTELEAKQLLINAGFNEIIIQKNVKLTKSALRFLRQGEVNPGEFLTKILHGEGYITLKCKKSTERLI